VKELTRKIVFEFVENVTRFDIFYVVLFGSAAKEKETPASDIDIFVVVDTRGDADEFKDTKEVKEAAFQLEKKYDRDIQLLITNRNYDRVEDYTMQKIFSEGIILYARAPEIKMNNVRVEPVSFVSYELSSLRHSEKMRFRNELYGYNTTRRYKEKVYKNVTPGLLKKLNGIKLSLGTVMVPKHALAPLEKMLDSYKIMYKEREVWVY
jgi:predicted nucleotidyltransferase